MHWRCHFLYNVIGWLAYYHVLTSFTGSGMWQRLSALQWKHVRNVCGNVAVETDGGSQRSALTNRKAAGNKRHEFVLFLARLVKSILEASIKAELGMQSVGKFRAKEESKKQSRSTVESGHRQTIGEPPERRNDHVIAYNGQNNTFFKL